MSKTKRKLAEWEAWDVLAVQFLRRTTRRNYHTALCPAVSSLESVGLITEETEDRMIERIGGYMGRTASGYAYEVEVDGYFGGRRWENDRSREAREGRANFALIMACESAWEASERAIEEFGRATKRHGSIILGNLETF